MESEKKLPSNKKQFDRSRLMVFFSYLVGLAVATVFSIFQAGLYPDQFVFTVFVGKLVINYGLAILMTYAALYDGKGIFRNLPDYQNSLGDFRSVKAKLFNLPLGGVFKMYCVDAFASEKQKKIDDMLAEKGIDPKYFAYPKNQLNKLTEQLIQVKEGDTVLYEYPVLTKEQVKYIMFVKGYQYDAMTDAMILSEDGGETDTYQAMNSKKRTKQAMNSALLPRAISMLLVSAVFAMLAFKSSTSTQQAVFDLVGRLCTMISSALSAYILASQIAGIEKQAFDLKTLFIRVFLNKVDNKEVKVSDNIAKSLERVMEVKPIEKHEEVVDKGNNGKCVEVPPKPSNEAILGKANDMLASVNK